MTNACLGSFWVRQTWLNRDKPNRDLRHVSQLAILAKHIRSIRRVSGIPVSTQLPLDLAA